MNLCHWLWLWLNGEAVCSILILEFYISPSNPWIVMGKFSHSVLLMNIAGEGILSPYITLNNKAQLQESWLSTGDMDPNLTKSTFPSTTRRVWTQDSGSWEAPKAKVARVLHCAALAGRGQLYVCLTAKGCFDSSAHWWAISVADAGSCAGDIPTVSLFPSIVVSCSLGWSVWGHVPASEYPKRKIESVFSQCSFRWRHIQNQIAVSFAVNIKLL